MPQSVPIQAIPNQTFIITLDGNLFDITIKETNGVMSVSMTVNGVATIDNARAVAGSPVIPSQYQEAGNFMFLTSNYELPDYLKFNVTQSLFYFSAAELAVFREEPSLPIKATDFNPIAQLPLRFAPQGYVSA